MSISNILFVDIESIPKKSAVDDSYEINLFMKKFAREIAEAEDRDINDFYRSKASLSAEFGKICNISIGQMRGDTFYIKSVAGEDEAEMLNQFVISLAKSEATRLCSHNGHDFDFPFIARRMWINKIAVPDILSPFSKKPWQLTDNLFDTMKIWSGVQYNYKCSLDLLAYCLGIDSPKSEMDGSMVYEKYAAKDFEAIKKYGSGDVLTLAKIFCKISGNQDVSFDKVSIY